MCHTEFPVDGMFGATSLNTSYTGGIKAAAPLSWGVLLPLHKMENPIPGKTTRSRYICNIHLKLKEKAIK